MVLQNISNVFFVRVRSQLVEIYKVLIVLGYPIDPLFLGKGVFGTELVNFLFFQLDIYSLGLLWGFRDTRLIYLFGAFYHLEGLRVFFAVASFHKLFLVVYFFHHLRLHWIQRLFSVKLSLKLPVELDIINNIFKFLFIVLLLSLLYIFRFGQFLFNWLDLLRFIWNF